MFSKLFCLIAIGIALLLSTSLHAAWQETLNGRMLGKRMPPLSASVKLQQGGVMLVDFSAPWCLACRDSVPLLNQYQRDYGARGLSVIGLARAPPLTLAPSAHHATASLEYPVGCDPGGVLSAQMGRRCMPYALLVDRNGIIVWQGKLSSLSRRTIETTLAAPALGELMRL